MVHIQWFNVKVKTIKEWHSSRVILRTLLFSNYINDVPSGIESTLNQVVDDTKLSSAVPHRITKF